MSLEQEEKERPTALSNRYFVLRHGRSLANEAHVICSHPDRGVLPEFALTDVGREQAATAGKTLAGLVAGEGGGSARDTLVFYASPFSRTKETAAVATHAIAETWGDAEPVDVTIAPEIRERYFGEELEGEPDTRYAEAWAKDAEDPSSVPSKGGESVLDVAERVVCLVERIEEQHTGKTVVLVGHGDTLQIAQVVFSALHQGRRTPSNEEARAHRSYAFRTGEFREITA